MNLPRPVIVNVFFSLLWFATSASAQEAPEQMVPAATNSCTPIVIQHLHIEHIHNLTIHASCPGALGRPPEAHAAIVPERRLEAAARPFRTILVPQQDVEDADVAVEDVGLEIHIFALGQADSTLIIGPKIDGKRLSLLIDMGEASNFGKNYELVAAKIEDLLGSKEITYFVATHYHFDHVGGKENGIAGLIKKSGVKIGTVIDVGELGDEFFGERSRRCPACS